MNNFTKRALTGAVFVTVLLGCTYFSQFSFAILFFIISVLGVWEFYGLAENTNTQPQKLLGIIVSSFVFASSALVSMNYLAPSFLLINIPLVFSVFIAELYTKASSPFTNIAYTLLGVFYVAVPFSLLNFITIIDGNYTYQLLFGFFFILWSNDTGAYLAGSALGKNKLFARVSPGKSWEGSIGGAILSLLVAYFISGWFTSIALLDWMIIAIILIVIGTLGDLVESLFKRSIGVKDSGTLLPGHGGILDRFDSLILASPFVFTYLYGVKNL